MAQLSCKQNAFLGQQLNSYGKRVDGIEKLMRRSRTITENSKGGVSKGR